MKKQKICVSIFQMEEESGSSKGPVACGSWIRRPEKVNLAVLARSRKKRGDSSSDSSPSVLQIFSFDPKTASLSSSPLVSLSLSLQNAFVFWKRFFNDFLEKFFFFFFQRFSLTVATVLALTFSPTKQRITFSGFLSNWVFCNFFFFGGLDHVCSWRSRWWSSFDYGAPKRWWDCVLYHKGWLQVSFFFINFHNFSYPLLCSYWFLWKLLLLL